MSSVFKVQFWGTRGSLPRPGRKTVRYGGNTSCIQVTAPDGTLVMIDCGSGAFDLGKALRADPHAPMQGHLLISHTHWDHIQGFPFFAPLFDKNWRWNIYGPAGLGESLRDTLAGQMQYSYFPVTLNDLGAKIHFHDLMEGELTIGGMTVTTRYLNHPVLTLGYRLEMDGMAIVYACDHEPHGWDASEPDVIHDLDRRHSEFFEGADLVIHDSQFTDEEYRTRKGWGHSPVGYVSKICQLAGVRIMALTHHDMSRTDDALDEILLAAREDLKSAGSAMEIIAAADGQLVEITPIPHQQRTSDKAHVSASVAPAMKKSSVLIGVADQKISMLLAEAASVGGVQITQAPDAVTTLQLARSSHPTLLIVEEHLSGKAGLDIYKSLQADADPQLREMSLMVVADREPTHAPEGVAVMKWLIKPFSVQYARAHIQAALMRCACRWLSAPIPLDEARRLATLHELEILDTPFEDRFDRITRIAAALAEVPIALVSLVDLERQWFKSCQGLDVSETSRELAFCAHVVYSRKPMIVKDTLLDDRLADSPVVVGGPRIRFYAGFPIFHDNGSCLGTLCLIDTRPRELSEGTLRLIEDLARIVEEELQTARETIST